MKKKIIRHPPLVLIIPVRDPELHKWKFWDWITFQYKNFSVSDFTVELFYKSLKKSGDLGLIKKEK